MYIREVIDPSCYLFPVPGKKDEYVGLKKITKIDDKEKEQLVVNDVGSGIIYSYLPIGIHVELISTALLYAQKEGDDKISCYGIVPPYHVVGFAKSDIQIVNRSSIFVTRFSVMPLNSVNMLIETYAKTIDLHGNNRVFTFYKPH